jgi:hypothetical protein
MTGSTFPPMRSRVSPIPTPLLSDTPTLSSLGAQPEPARSRCDQLDANAAPLAPDAIVKVGDRVTIAPSTISGWEARLTRGWTAYDVTLDGKPVKASDFGGRLLSDK